MNFKTLWRWVGSIVFHGKEQFMPSSLCLKGLFSIDPECSSCCSLDLWVAHREGLLASCKAWGAAEPMPFHWHAETLLGGIVNSSLPGRGKARKAGGVWRHFAEMIPSLHVSGFPLDTSEDV